jgi:hypothetical protein
MSLQIVNSKTILTPVENPKERKHPVEYGKLFGREEADRLFGPVLHSVPMTTESLKKYSELTKDYLMYNIKGNEVYLLNNKRVPITPAGISVPRDEPYKVCAMSVVRDLLSFGNRDLTFFEERESTLTITNGEYTLEMAPICPPFCT